MMARAGGSKEGNFFEHSDVLVKAWRFLSDRGYKVENDSTPSRSCERIRTMLGWALRIRLNEIKQKSLLTLNVFCLLVISTTNFTMIYEALLTVVRTV